MTLRLVQFQTNAGGRAVAAIGNDTKGQIVAGVTSTYELAAKAIAGKTSLASATAKQGFDGIVDISALLADGRVMAPIDHPDPAHLVVTGTGLTHLGSAEGRDSMHKKGSEVGVLTDSMRLFQLGVEGGKPAPGETGFQPEWFYKGDGGSIIAPEATFPSPTFAKDGGEEPEIAGLYLIGDDGLPYRLGFALGNEFSDHVTEMFNYLWLAHSKLRPSSLGPELLTGQLPQSIVGRSRVRRGDTTVFDQLFLSGELNMSHTIANLEVHHFKYPGFRRPGDVHVHFFGTATLSFSAGVTTLPGDVFEIEADAFLLPLRNRLGSAAPSKIQVTQL